MNLTVYTTRFGATDPLMEPRAASSARFVCFTDQAPPRRTRWEIVRVPRLDAPKRESRKYKQRPHIIFPDADLTLWLDCCLILYVDPMAVAREFGGEFTAFVHHKRKRITDEAEAIIKAGKGKADAIYAQLAAYKAQGWDTDSNPQKKIHNGGMLLRRHTPKVIEHAEAWHAEVQGRTLRDQMSIDFTAHRVGLRIDDFPGVINQNRLCRIFHFPTKTTDF